MTSPRITVVGGGAAGFFAAITCAEARPEARVAVLERGPQFLAKVRISGGGRCNVTHACFDPDELATRYPRGERELRRLFHRFQPADAVEWFESRGVALKTQEDGRMFPVTDSSLTIIQCLVEGARAAGVELRTGCDVTAVTRQPGGGFQITLAEGPPRESECLLLATGGCRAAAAGQIAESLGHRLESPVPSLFTFNVEVPWLRELAGVAMVDAEASVAGTGLRERGPILITHWGLSGPAILRLSAWGARRLAALDYRFPVLVNWLPELGAEGVTAALQAQRAAVPARFVVNTPVASVPSRLWERLVLAAGIRPDTRWSTVSRGDQHRLVQQLIRTELPVTGKSLNKDEFVTCGGVPLGEVNLQTMESRICPGLYFAGELLDIDGITGGFNFQAAWTTGWIAGNALASDPGRG
jgi:predicted Rossmann fold flavoprotein